MSQPSSDIRSRVHLLLKQKRNMANFKPIATPQQIKNRHKIQLKQVDIKINQIRLQKQIKERKLEKLWNTSNFNRQIIQKVSDYTDPRVRLNEYSFSQNGRQQYCQNADNIDKTDNALHSQVSQNINKSKQIIKQIEMMQDKKMTQNVQIPSQSLFSLQQKPVVNNSIFNKKDQIIEQKPKDIFSFSSSSNIEGIFRPKNTTQTNIFRSNTQCCLTTPGNIFSVKKIQTQPQHSSLFATSLAELNQQNKIVQIQQTKQNKQKQNPFAANTTENIFANKTNPKESSSPYKQHQKKQAIKEEKLINLDQLQNKKQKDTFEKQTENNFLSKPSVPASQNKVVTNSLFSQLAPTNIFNQNSLPGINNIFSQKITPGNLFSQPTTNNLFNNNNIEQNKTELKNQGGLFGQVKGNIFLNPSQSGSGSSLFGPTNMFNKGNTQGSLFSNSNKQDGQQYENDDQEGGDQDEMIEDKNQIDPALSTGNYKYAETQISFKQNAAKFKIDNGNIFQGISISIQKVSDVGQKLIFVRLPNKQLLFYGMVLKGKSQIKKLSDKSIVLKGCIRCDQPAKTIISLKISMKETAHCDNFFNIVSQMIKAT